MLPSVAFVKAAAANSSSVMRKSWFGRAVAGSKKHDNPTMVLLQSPFTGEKV